MLNLYYRQREHNCYAVRGLLYILSIPSVRHQSSSGLRGCPLTAPAWHKGNASLILQTGPVPPSFLRRCGCCDKFANAELIWYSWLFALHPSANRATPVMNSRTTWERGGMSLTSPRCAHGMYSSLSYNFGPYVNGFPSCIPAVECARLNARSSPCHDFPSS